MSDAPELSILQQWADDAREAEAERSMLKREIARLTTMVAERDAEIHRLQTNADAALKAIDQVRACFERIRIIAQEASAVAASALKK